MEREEFRFKFNTIGQKVFGGLFFGIFIIILSIIGSVFAFLTLSFYESGENPLLVWSVFSGAITCFSFAAIMLTSLFSGIYIKEFYFNIKSERFEILESDGRKAFISFSEIAEFNVQQIFRQSGSSYGSKGHTYYQVYFVKKDGALVEINDFENQLDAETLLKQLVSSVILKEGGNESDFGETKVPPLFTIQESSNGKTIYTWKSNTGFLRSFIGFFTVISFINTFTSIMIFMESGWFFYIFGGSILSLFLFLILNRIWKMIYIRNYILEIDNHKIVYGLNTLLGYSKKKEMSSQEMFGTQVNLEFRNLQSGLLEMLIVTKDQYGKLGNFRQKQLNASNILKLFSDMILFQKQLLKLEFPGFSVTDVIQFEKIIDRRNNNPF